MSCEKWSALRDRKDQVTGMFLSSWVQGFLSGLNAQRYRLTNQPMVSLPEAGVLLEHVDKACAEGSSREVFVIAMELFDGLLPQ